MEQDRRPSTYYLRNAVDAGIAAVTGAIEKAQNEVISLLGNGDISDDYRRRKMDEVKQMVVETYTAEVETRCQSPRNLTRANC